VIKAASYYNAGGINVVSRRYRTRGVSRVLAVVFAFVIVLSTLSLGFLTSVKADVFTDLTCGTGDIGYNTSMIGTNGEGVFHASESLHKYTIQDMYAPSIGWSTYNGSPDPGKIGAGGDDATFGGIDRGEGSGVDSGTAGGFTDRNKNIQTSSSGVRQSMPCLGRYVGGLISNGILRIASMNMTMTSFFVTNAVNPTIICQDVSGNWNHGPCINLLGVIGGTGQNGSDGGIIGRLYSGLYQGLIIIVMAVVGIWLLWTGIAKHKIREAFGGLVWALLLFAGGVIMLNNPLLLAQAPMKIGTSIGACVVEGLNGIGCWDPNGNVSNGTTAAEGTECYLDVGSADGYSEQLSLIARSSTCTMWKAFVLEPWSLGQFGTTYANLYTGGLNSSEGSFMKGFKDQDAVKYWKSIAVSMYSADGNMNNICTDQTSKWRYSNIALYQLNLQTKYHDCTGTAKDIPYHDTATVNKTGNAVYGDWYYMVDLMATAKTTAGAEDPSQDVSTAWWYWYGGYAGTRFGISLIAVIASLLGGFVLSVTALYALMYMFAGVLLMTFAPLFLLFGIIPGQGKRIFLGWLEQVISSIMKYFASILWMLIGVELYDAVLGASNSLGTSFLFVIIVTMTVWMYRKEFVEMIGKVDMGGQKMSNKFGEFISSKGAAAKRMAVAGVGGYAGGYLAGNDNVKKYDGKWYNVGGRMKNTMRNAKERSIAANDLGKWSVTQQAKRGNGIFSNAARASDSIQDTRRKNALDDARTTKKTLTAAEDHLRQSTGLTAEKALDTDISAERAGLMNAHENEIADHRKTLNDTEALTSGFNDRKTEISKAIEKAANYGRREKVAMLNGDESFNIKPESAKAYQRYQQLETQLNTDSDKLTDEQKNKISQEMSMSKDGYDKINSVFLRDKRDYEEKNLQGNDKYSSMDDVENDRDSATKNIESADNKYESNVKKLDEVATYKKVLAAKRAADINMERLSKRSKAGKIRRDDMKSIADSRDSVTDVINSKGEIDSDSMDALGMRVNPMKKNARKFRRINRKMNNRTKN
jgi:hypothetical protein